MKVEYKTRSRNVIVEYLKENADRRFTAKDIIDAISDEGKNVNRTTIYRNLERLCQALLSSSALPFSLSPAPIVNHSVFVPLSS